MRLVARVIAKVFDPVIVIPLIILGIGLMAVVNGYNWEFLIVLMFLDAVVPGTYVIVRYIKKGHDWDIRDRKERIPLYGLTVASHLLGVLAAYYMDIHPMAEILLGLWLLSLIFAVITYFWKISVHAGVNSVLAFFVIFFFGWEYWWIWLIPVMVGWARIEDNHHSVGQVVLGLLVPPLFLGAFYTWIGIM